MFEDGCSQCKKTEYSDGSETCAGAVPDSVESKEQAEADQHVDQVTEGPSVPIAESEVETAQHPDEVPSEPTAEVSEGSVESSEKVAEEPSGIEKSKAEVPECKPEHKEGQDSSATETEQPEGESSKNENEKGESNPKDGEKTDAEKEAEKKWEDMSDEEKDKMVKNLFDVISNYYRPHVGHSIEFIGERILHEQNLRYIQTDC